MWSTTSVNVVVARRSPLCPRTRTKPLVVVEEEEGGGEIHDRKLVLN